MQCRAAAYQTFNTVQLVLFQGVLDMSVCKDEKRGTWYVTFYYTDWRGRRIHKKKRGFARKKDAQAWEAEFLHSSAGSCDMLFGDFVEIYLSDMENRLKQNTMQNKRSMIQTKIVPYFADLRLNEITPVHRCGGGRLKSWPRIRRQLTPRPSTTSFLLF